MNQREMQRKLHRMLRVAQALADMDEADRDWVESKRRALVDQRHHARRLVESIVSSPLLHERNEG